MTLIKSNDLQTWIDWYYSQFEQRHVPYFNCQLPLFLITILPGVTAYLLGLAIAWLYDFHPVYVRTVPVYLGVFGTVWVTGSIRWASVRFHQRLAEMRPCFNVEDTIYRQKVGHWIMKFGRNRDVSLFSLVFILFFGSLSAVSVYYGEHLPSLTLGSLRPASFPQEWYSGNLFLNMLVIDIFVVFCGLPLATAVWMVGVNVRVLLDMKTMETVPLPVVLLTKLRGMTNFYLSVSFTWYVGVALFGILLFNDFDTFAVAIMLGFGSIGLLVFFVPQYVFHVFLVSAYNEIADGVLAMYKTTFKGRPLRDLAKLIIESDGKKSNNEGDVDENVVAEFRAFSDMVEFSEPGQLWVYDLNDVLVLILGQAIALGALAVRASVTG